MFIPYCDRTQLQHPSSVDPGLLELTIAALLPAQPTLSCSPTLLSPPGACKREALDGGQGSISQDELPSTGKTSCLWAALSSGLLERSDSRRRATSTSSCRFLIVSRHLGSFCTCNWPLALSIGRPLLQPDARHFTHSCLIQHVPVGLTSEILPQPSCSRQGSRFSNSGRWPAWPIPMRWHHTASRLTLLAISHSPAAMSRSDRLCSQPRSGTIVFCTGNALQQEVMVPRGLDAQGTRTHCSTGRPTLGGCHSFSHGELWPPTVSSVLLGTCSVAVDCHHVHSRQLTHEKFRRPVPAEVSTAAEQFEMRLGRSLHAPSVPECGACSLRPPTASSFPRNPFFYFPFPST